MFPARFFTFKLSPKYTSALTNLQRNSIKETNQHTTKTTLSEKQLELTFQAVASFGILKRIGYRNQSHSPIQATDNDSLSKFRSPDQIECPVFPCVITPDVSFPNFRDQVLQVFRVNIDAIFGSILHEQAVSLVQTIIGKKPPRRLWYPP